MISSKQLLEETGISRATLNNYIRRGLLPRPQIRTGADEADGGARLGFFNNDAINRIKEVQTMNRSGLSMDQITEELVGELPPETLHDIENHPARPFALAETYHVSLDSYDSPAYMVNNQFELIWWNDAAVEQLLPDCNELPGELEARSLFKLLMSGPICQLDETEIDLIAACHMAAGSRRLTREKSCDLMHGLPVERQARCSALLDELEQPGDDPVICFPLTDGVSPGPMGYEQIFASYFREGILFTYGRADQSVQLASALSHRSKLVAGLLSQRKPHITPMAVMVADLQNSVGLCAELPAEEYFDLINEVWQRAEPIFRKYHATYGRHAGDGMLYYFLPQPDSDFKLNAIACALELTAMMRQMTKRWQERKGWFNELYLNVGLHEGREWFGAFHAGAHVEFTVLGDTVNQASRLSDFARDGSIWATKSMINQVPSHDRQLIHYGVYRNGERGERRLVAQSYACIRDLVKPEQTISEKFRAIEMLPITEILAMDSESE